MTVISSAGGFAQLIDDQEGLATTSQLARHGYDRDQLMHRVETGQWVRVLHGVIATSNGCLTRSMVLRAALLYGGPRAVLSHRSAGEEWLMLRVRSEDEPVHITVPYGQSALCQRPTLRTPTVRLAPEAHRCVHPGVVVHRSKAFEHITIDGDFPRTTAAATAIDLAVAEPTPRLAMITLVAAVTEARIPIWRIREHVEKRRPRRYRRPIADALAMLDDGVASVLEHRYALDVEQAHGLPPGRRQSPVIVDGRALYEDVDYSPLGVPLIVRLDGARFHFRRTVRFRDRRRDNAAEMAGRPRLVYGWDETVEEPCGIFDEVREVLVREGWPDSSRPCERCATRR